MLERTLNQMKQIDMGDEILQSFFKKIRIPYISLRDDSFIEGLESLVYSDIHSEEQLKELQEKISKISDEFKKVLVSSEYLKEKELEIVFHASFCQLEKELVEFLDDEWQKKIKVLEEQRELKRLEGLKTDLLASLSNIKI